MAVRFNTGNTPKPYLSAAAHSSQTLPNTAWSIFFIMQIQQNEGRFNYILSMGAVNQATGGLNIVWSSTAPADNYKFIIYLSNLGASGVVIKTTNTFTTTSGWFGVLLSRSATGQLTLKTCPILSTDPSDGSAVALQGTFGTTLAAAYSGTGFAIGARASDLEATRYYNNHLTRLFKVNAAITDLQFAKLCYGYPPSELGISPAWYFRFNDNTDTSEQIGAFTATLTGSLATVANPAFGYDTAQSNSFAITGGYQNHQIYVVTNITQATQTVQASGTWTGLIPNRIQYRVYAYNGTTVLQDWVDAVNPTINGAGTWSINAVVNAAGGKKRLQARSYNNTTLLATANIRTEAFGVGVFLYTLGSSSASEGYAFEAHQTAPLNPEAPMSFYKIATGYEAMNTASPTTINPMAALGNYIFAQTGLCTLFSTSAISGTSLSPDWVSNTMLNLGTAYTNHGHINAIFLTVGSNDAQAGTIVSYEAHYANYQTVINTARSRTSATTPILIQSSAKRSGGVNAEQWDWCRQVEHDICQANSYMSYNSVIKRATRDGIHLTVPEFEEFYRTQLAVNFLRILQGLPVLQGNKISHIKFKPNGTSCLLLSPINGAAADLLTPTSGYTGFTFSDDSGSLTVSGYTLLENSTIRVNFSRAIVGVLVVKYLSGANPNTTTLPHNQSNGLPMNICTRTTAIPDVPRLGGLISVRGM